MPDIFRSVQTIIILSIIFTIIVAIATIFDLPSYLATDTEQLSADNATSKALIVYDPGIMGMGTRTAHWLGEDLRIRGYEVNISGIRSHGIENATDMDVVIVIGPTYFDGPTGPISGYLQQVQTKPGARIGIYSITGLLGDDAGPQMRRALEDRSIVVKSADSVSAWDKGAEEKSYAFIFGMLE
ncbi:hypothetical protein [Methanocella sp. MCL-LM]|uniref:hypothetical protein n=1 Tax=Methanocella sp. MCL-LM TaxID=3412035 RepID=UPI003C76155E